MIQQVRERLTVYRDVQLFASADPLSSHFGKRPARKYFRAVFTSSRPSWPAIFLSSFLSVGDHPGLLLARNAESPSGFNRYFRIGQSPSERRSSGMLSPCPFQLLLCHSLLSPLTDLGTPLFESWAGLNPRLEVGSFVRNYEEFCTSAYKLEPYWRNENWFF